MSEGPIILFGEVSSTEDPEHLGRVQVRMAGLGKELVLPWLRIVLPYASAGAGFALLPEKGDEVAVLRGADNHPDAMLVLGAVHNGSRKPPVPAQDGQNNLKQIRTRSGHTIALQDRKGHEQISIATGDQKLVLLLDQKVGQITVTGDKEIALRAEGKVRVQAAEVVLSGSKHITIKGESKLTLEGKSSVDIHSSGKIKLHGGLVQITGSAVELG